MVAPGTHPPEPPSISRARVKAAPVDVVVTAPDLGTARACLAAGASRVLLRVYAGDAITDLPAGIEPLVPRIAHAADIRGLTGWIRRGGYPAVGTLGELAAARDAGAHAEADWPLNVTNSWSAAAVADLGASFVWASPELTGARLRDVVAGSPIPVGALVYGRLELMVSEHCILQAAGECAGKCATCSRRAARWTLLDQKEYGFPITTDISGRSHVYNSVTLDLSRALDEVLATGVAALRLDMTTESADDATRIVAAFVDLATAVGAGGAPPETAIASPATSGHFFRGVR